MPPTNEAQPSTPSAARLLVLNAVFPGLGHLVAGRRGWALILALPVLIVMAVGFVVVLGGDITSLAARLFDPVVLGALLGLQTLLVLWRLGALAAVRQITPIRATVQTLAAGVVAVAIVLLPQLWVAGLTLDARDSAAAV